MANDKIAEKPAESQGIGAKNAPKRGRGRPIEYPWDQWFAQIAIVLRQGRDFTSSITSMSKLIRRTAAARGLGVTIRDNADGSLFVEIHPNA